eukprot:13590056-Heterocapsa_arctica.AAC.1
MEVGTGMAQALEGVVGRFACANIVGQDHLSDGLSSIISSGSGTSRGAGDPGRLAGRGAPDADG